MIGRVFTLTGYECTVDLHVVCGAKKGSEGLKGIHINQIQINVLLIWFVGIKGVIGRVFTLTSYECTVDLVCGGKRGQKV